MRKIITLLFCVATTLTFSQVPISSSFYGGNLWYSKYTTRSSTAPMSPANWTRLKAAGMTMMRFGGKNFNTGSEKPTNPIYYVDVADDIRSQGMEPMISVPLEGFDYTFNDNKIMDKLRSHRKKVKFFCQRFNAFTKV